jgi:hypothetical protein
MYYCVVPISFLITRSQSQVHVRAAARLPFCLHLRLDISSSISLLEVESLDKYQEVNSCLSQSNRET